MLEIINKIIHTVGFSVLMAAFLIGLFVLFVSGFEFAKNKTKIFMYVVEYIWYRKHFKMWFEANKGKRLDALEPDPKAKEYCFECEIETTLKYNKNKAPYCGQCKLRH